MRLYDIVVLVTPDLADDDAAKSRASIGRSWSTAAPPSSRKSRGASAASPSRSGASARPTTTYWQVQSEPAAVAEVERRMGLSDQVLRHLAVRVDEDLKRQAKMTERLRKKAIKRPPRPPAPPSDAAAAEPAVERSES